MLSINNFFPSGRPLSCVADNHWLACRQPMAGSRLFETAPIPATSLTSLALQQLHFTILDDGAGSSFSIPDSDGAQRAF